MRKKVGEMLDKLDEDDIIENAEGPIPWVSVLVVVPKANDKDPRICIDMRWANLAIERERHPIPTVEIIQHMSGSTVFSVLYLCKGFHQIELAKESRYITTFA